MKKRCLVIILCSLLLSGCGSTEVQSEEALLDGVENSVSETVGQTSEVNLIDNVAYEEVFSENQYVVKFQNGNDIDILLEAEVTFKNADGNVEGTAFDSIFCFHRNSSGVLAFDMPHTETEYVSGITPEISLSASETGIFAPESSSVDKFTIEHNLTENEDVTVSCTNTSDKQVDNVRLMCIYYLDGAPVGHDEYVYLECTAGATFDYTFYKPYDSILGDMEFDSYEVCVLSAFDDNY